MHATTLKHTQYECHYMWTHTIPPVKARHMWRYPRLHTIPVPLPLATPNVSVSPLSAANM